MLVIRFQRVGRKNDPAFRIVVVEKQSRPKSAGHEALGSFYPKTKDLRLDRERVLYWLSKGAKPSPRVHNILVSEKVIQDRKINVAGKKVRAETVEAVKPMGAPEAGKAEAAEAEVREPALVEAVGEPHEAS